MTYTAITDSDNVLDSNYDNDDKNNKNQMDLY